MFSISQLSVALLLPVCSLATPLPTASAPASTIEVAPTFTCHCDGSDPKIWSGKYKPTRLSMQGTTVCQSAFREYLDSIAHSLCTTPYSQAHEILLADPNNLPALRHECIEQCYFIAGCNMARLDPTDPRVCEAYFFEVSTISSTESWTPSELPNGLGAWFLVPPGYPLCSESVPIPSNDSYLTC